MAGIVFQNVSKRFNGTEVIRGLDLHIADGEFFTFVGPSGCGKSTILNMIAGLEPLSEGKILLDGREVSALSPRERDVAMVFQSYALYPHMTVFENLSFPLRMKKSPRDFTDAEVRRVAGMLGLDSMLRRKPRELSGGQRQRVALGRAIIRRPRVFLMDEPLSNLDARLRVEMRAEIKRLHRELGITTVYVTHDQAEALGLSERMAVLHNGVIQQCDEPGRVYREPANTFVAGFIGSPPINLVPGNLNERGEISALGTVIARLPRLKGKAGPGGLTVGIRPEDISVTPARKKNGIELVVTLIEPAGSFNWAELRRGDIALRGTAGEAGARLSLSRRESSSSSTRKADSGFEGHSHRDLVRAAGNFRDESCRAPSLSCGV